MTTSKRYRIEPLGTRHDRRAFASGVAELDRYLHQQAGQDVRNLVAAVYVLNDTVEQRIVGYYTLSATNVELNQLDPLLRKRLPRYPMQPATLLGRLAVDQRDQRHGWGRILLYSALRRAWRHAGEIGSMAVVVDAIDDRARAFYERYGFIRFRDHEYRLYLPMKTIADLDAEVAVSESRPATQPEGSGG